MFADFIEECVKGLLFSVGKAIPLQTWTGLELQDGEATRISK
jgi:hypothetical protein